MSETCQMVVFSNKAYNAIIRESFDKDPVETGGILLGHVLDNGIWIVMEVLPPGINSIFETAYFEYDDAFVNYLAQSVANQYKTPLELLGLWHRHPGSMDFFSRTDDHTNAVFAAQNSYGAISGLVNLDPNFRLTMYHLGSSTHLNARPGYETIPIEVGDDIIPEDYFELRYYDGNESNLHPVVDRSTRTARATEVNSHTSDSSNPKTESTPKQEVFRPKPPVDTDKAKTDTEDKPGDTLLSFIRRNKVLVILLLASVFVLALKSYRNHHKAGSENVANATIDISIGEEVSLKRYRPIKCITSDITWISSSDALVIHKDKAIGVKAGTATVSAFYKRKSKDVLTVNVFNHRHSINKRSLILQSGQCDTLTVEPKADKVKWFSSNAKIASVNKHGIVSAVSEGHCVVNCEIGDEIIGTCSVEVVSSEEIDENSSKKDTAVLTVSL